jgi:hypothetical protein
MQKKTAVKTAWYWGLQAVLAQACKRKKCFFIKKKEKDSYELSISLLYFSRIFSKSPVCPGTVKDH